jgi:membrane-bound ClpP family serine protease
VHDDIPRAEKDPNPPTQYHQIEEKLMFALGLLLVLLGAALVAAEAHVPSHGALGSGAVVALALGVALLFSAAGSAALVAVFAALGVALAGGGWMLVLVRKGLATRRLSERNTLIGRVGVARAPDCVFVDGALWRARLWGLEDEAPLARGDPVVVEHVNGLTLTVRPAEEWEVAP